MRFKKSLSTFLLGMYASCGLVYAAGEDSNRNANEALIAVQGRSTMQHQKKKVSAEDYLLKGSLQEGEKSLLAEISEHKGDDQLRFGLAIIQVLRAFEQIVQDLHRYGLRQLSLREIGGPLSRVPIPKNAAPETLNYQKTRKIFETFVANLTKAEATLGEMHDENVKLPLRFGLLRFDVTGDGRVGEQETLWRGYAAMTGNAEITAEKAKSFSITFDRGDVHWLRGYCHLLMAPFEILLAHDFQESFERTGHLFFPKIDSPYDYLHKGKHVRSIGSDKMDITDLIAFIHLVNWEVKEPQRMSAALNHLEQVISLSRVSWKSIMAETDDDNEWLPNPKQTGVIPNVRVTEAMVTAWSEVMNELEKLLKGELLLPFWRGDDTRGINLRRVFLEPRRLDLVLWVQGSAAAPYLEQGKKSKGETWRLLRGEFGGHFPGFALWFN